MLLEEIREQAFQIREEVIRMRRHLHANPELSFQETETSAFVKSYLGSLGIPWQAIGTTGVVALIEGGQASGNVVALRADMDALPITELNELPYTSRHRGVMHACGHDAHTSSLLGTATILQRLRSRFSGSVKFIFQPGEEKLPGGAQLLIREGVLENPRPGAVIGQHVMPQLPTGKIAIRKGKHMASMDELTVTVTGKGGHGAQPHMNIDPVLISSHIIVALQQIVSRFTDPMLPTVLSFGKFIADGGINIIPDKVYMEGTFRTFEETWREEAHRRMKKMAESIAESMGGTCEFNIVRGYPCLVNEAKLTGELRGYAEQYLGKENVVDAELWTAAEDFAYYSQSADSCFYLLGTGNTEKNTNFSLHSPCFNIDEDALGLSTGLMAYCALKRLGN